MNVNIEKILFKYILENRRYFEYALPSFFQNRQLQFVYEVLRDYMLDKESLDKPTPKPAQILQMVKLKDNDEIITPPVLKSMLTTKLDDYDEDNFILPNLKAWILSNSVKNGVSSIIDEARELDKVGTFADIERITNNIKNIIDMSSTLNIDEDLSDLGSDFDDVESHFQDTSNTKVPTGFYTIDGILGGGFDIGTLNILMGETNQGKSLWMQNLAVKAADNGSNVLYITLEMTEKKIMKRLGAMRLKIPINEYDTISQDTQYIQSKIDNLHGRNNKNDFANMGKRPIGKIYSKFWAAGTANIDDFDRYIQRLYEKKGIKIDFIVVDYITLIAPRKGEADNLYMKGKVLAEGLRALAAKHECPVLTAIQVAKGAWNSVDITLESIPESKAIAETADTFFAIIRTEEMKKMNTYNLKLLKQRDGDFSHSRLKIMLNTTYLTLENDEYMDSL